MEYQHHQSHPHGFIGASQSFHNPFMEISPLTPANSNSTPEEYNPNASPSDHSDRHSANLSHDQQFQQTTTPFEPYAYFNNQSFGGSPTQSSQQPHHHHIPPHQHQQPPPQLPGEIHSHQYPVIKADPGEDLGLPPHLNSDEDDRLPAQSRRKAQNRAAQRAFRERKERHVKDLEAKVAALEAARQETLTENDQLRRDLHKVSTENEILRATTALRQSPGPGPGGRDDPLARASSADIGNRTTGPPMEVRSPGSFYSTVLKNHANKTPSHRVVTKESGEKLLAAGAMWEYIVAHELYKSGRVDLVYLSHRLKNEAQCDGIGPVFPEASVEEAIRESVLDDGRL